MSEHNDNSSESNSVGSDTFFQSARINRASNSILRQSVLRPSVLDTAVNSSTSSCSELPKASTAPSLNPFNKDIDENEDPDEEQGAAAIKTNDDTKTTKDEKVTNAENENKKDSKIAEPDEQRPDPMTLLRKNGLERSNLFAAAKNSIPRVETSSFVFGENVHERVVGENVDSNAKSDANMNGTNVKGSEMLFSSVIQNAAKAHDSNNEGAAAAVVTSKDNEAKSLDEVAREYEESRAQKRKYEEVETFTGEENEVNIVDISCKLFAFVNSNWEERGRGSLRLNSANDDYECSRVVFRTSGNLRLLLNTKVWAGMVAERPSQKSLRLTAMDSTGKIKIYLLMGRPADITHLYNALFDRITLRKCTHPFEDQNNGTDESYETEEEAIKNGATVISSTVDDAPEDSESGISTNDKDDADSVEQKDVATVLSEDAVSKSKEADEEKEIAEPSLKKKLVEVDEGKN